MYTCAEGICMCAIHRCYIYTYTYIYIHIYMYVYVPMLFFIICWRSNLCSPLSPTKFMFAPSQEAFCSVAGGPCLVSAMTSNTIYILSVE